MSKRRRQPDPAHPANWQGQPYTPHDPYYFTTGRGRFVFPHPLWMLARSRYRYGCLLGLLLTGSLILIVAAIAQTDNFGLQAVLFLVCCAVLLILAGAFLARFLPRSRKAAGHHRHHHSHRR
jgi:hypothetical protein